VGGVVGGNPWWLKRSEAASMIAGGTPRSRSLAIVPAASRGDLLYQVSPAFPFLRAGAIGFAGVLLFALTVEERHAR
jgi:hypothetical protein